MLWDIPIENCKVDPKQVLRVLQNPLSQTTGFGLSLVHPGGASGRLQGWPCHLCQSPRILPV